MSSFKQNDIFGRIRKPTLTKGNLSLAKAKEKLAYRKPKKRKDVMNARKSGESGPGGAVAHLAGSGSGLGSASSKVKSGFLKNKKTGNGVDGSIMDVGAPGGGDDYSGDLLAALDKPIEETKYAHGKEGAAGGKGVQYDTDGGSKKKRGPHKKLTKVEKAKLLNDAAAGDYRRKRNDSLWKAITKAYIRNYERILELR